MNYAELIQGMPDGSIAPLATTNRAQTAAALQRFIYGFIGDEGFEIALIPLAATHMDTAGHWAEQYITFVYIRGVMRGVS